MRPRTLGYAVLAYAALTSTRLLLPGDAGGWWALGASIWLAYVGGGLGLLYGKTRGRAMLLAGSAVSLIADAVWVIDMLRSGFEGDVPRAVSAFPWVELATDVLPAFGIFLAAMRLASPESDRRQRSVTHVAKAAPPPGLELAYGSFAWIALVLCTGPLSLLLPLEPGTAQGLGMIVGIPMAMVTLVVGITGLVLSVVHRREWPLPVMSTAVVSLPFVFWLEEEWKYSNEHPLHAWYGVTTWYGVSTIVVVILCLRWYARARGRWVSKQQPMAG